MGFYTALEDKWYDFLDVADKVIPVYGVVDKIDGVIPSFILFIAILVLIVAGIGLFFFSTGLSSGGTYSVELTVSGKSDAPLQGALVELDQQCTDGEKQLSLLTNAQGKITFDACANVVTAQISKEGYLPATISLSLPDERIKKVTLSEKVTIQRHLTVNVVDDATNTLISKAQLFVLCTAKGTTTSTQVHTALSGNAQPDNGFAFDYNDSCDSTNLKATALEYSDKTVSLSSNETTKQIALSKIVLTGTIVFTADSPIGVQSGVQITTTNSIGANQTLFTIADGEATTDLPEGDYTYTAYVNGYTEDGNFSILANQTTREVIYFADLTNNQPLSSIKKLYLQTVDTNGPVVSSEARMFYTKGTDTNFFTAVTPTITGIIGPTQVVDTNGKTFTAIIKASGYQTKLVAAQLLDSNALPQQVQMVQGGNALNVRVIDDLGRVITNAATKLYINGFNGEFEKAVYTDSNGIAAFKNLPNGTYNIVSQTTTDSGQKSITISGYNQDTNLTITTGTGTIRFDFYAESGAVSPDYKIQELIGDDFNTIYVGTATKYGTTPTLKVGNVVRVIVNDDNFLPYQSMDYTITRENADRYIYLRQTQNLPNQNEVQMLLRNIYTTNPLVAKENSATKLLAGQTYYFLFDAVLNTSGAADTKANIYISGDKNASTQGMLIESLQSIDGTSSIMGSTNNGFNISDSDIVAQDAKQLNFIAGIQDAPNQIPLLVKVTLDANAFGSQKIYWQLKFGDKESLLYSKEFSVGNAFCFDGTSTPCPIVLFSSFIKWNDRNYAPLSDATYALRNGDSYNLQVNAQNITDKAYGDVKLWLSADTTNASKISFSLNASVISTSTTNVNSLDAFTTTSTLTTQVVPKQTGSVDITQEVRNSNGTDSLAGLKGNMQKLHFTIGNKKQLVIEVYADGIKNTIFEKSDYPFFLVKTKIKDANASDAIAKPVNAIWSAQVVGAAQPIYSGQPTDANGTWIQRFDASNYSSGTVINFTAIDDKDDNYSLPASLQIVVSKPFQDAPSEIPECLSVKIGGVDIATLDNPHVDVNVGSAARIAVDSNCTEDRSIHVNTELYVEGGIDFTISPGFRKTLALTPDGAVATNQGLLGAYQVHITTLSGNQTKVLGDIDVIVNDPSSPFVLSNAIFDLRATQQVSAKVTNTQFAGRKDLYYPKMAIDEPAVDLQYQKNGVPNSLDLNIIVESTGINAATFGYVLANKIEQSQDGGDCTASPPTQSITAPSALMFNDYATYGQNIDPYSSIYNSATEKYLASDYTHYVSENWNGRDPTKSFFSLTPAEQNEVLTAQTQTSSGLESDSSNNSSKETKAAFELQDIPLRGNPFAPVAGDVYETFPNTIGANNNVTSNCQRTVTLPWKDVTLPTSFNSTNWNSFVEDGNARLKVLGTSGTTSVQSFGYYGPGNISGVLSTKGFVQSGGGGGGGGWASYNNSQSDTLHFGGLGDLTLQSELIRVVTVQNENKTAQAITINSFTPTEGVVKSIGSYTQSLYSNSKWVAPKLFGRTDMQQFTDGSTLVKPLGQTSYSGIYIPLEYAEKNGAQYPIPSQRNPLALYNTDGKTFARIVPSSIPQGVRAFLKDGKVYAEYIGTYHTSSDGSVVIDAPPVNSPVIDFNVIKIDTLGTSYAILTVGDWVGDTKVTKQFRVKLLGSEANCYSQSGDQGVSGAAYVPKLLLNWDWATVGENQCDAFIQGGTASNPISTINTNYTYCDATQFTISLFKKLQKINDTLTAGDISSLPKYTGFYAFLLKDNHSQGFLQDFMNYYSSTLGGAPTYFTTIGSTPGLDKLISDNRIKYQIRNDDGSITQSGSLPKAGLYRVEIDVNQDSLANQGLLTTTGSNANITITFTLSKEAANYNPLFETPFDGSVGKNDAGYARSGYGVSTQGAQIPIIDTTTSQNAPGALKNIAVVYPQTLNELNTQTVLSYDGTTFDFYPSQPNPVAMSITSTGGAVNASYYYTSDTFDKQQTVKKDWTLLGSTISNDCTDFSGNRANIFTETASGSTRTLSWPNATKSGTLTLGTVIFTPKSSATTSVALNTAVPQTVALNTSIDGLKNSTALMLKYYDQQGITNYDTLQGIYSMIANKQLCISTANKNTVKVWWNPDYLKTLLQNLPADGAVCLK